MSSLYNLTEDFENISNMLYDPDVDIQTVLDTLESIEYEFEEKAVGYAKIIKSIQTDAEKIKEEEIRLSERRRMFENRARIIKNTLEDAMRITGKTKFKTPLFNFNIQKNGGLRALKLDVDVNELPAQYKILQDPLPANEEIRKYFKETDVDKCEWAHLEPQGESLRITGIKTKG